MLFLNILAVHSWAAYANAISSICDFSRGITYLVAGAIGFLAAWTMRKAFMSEEEAGFAAWKRNANEYIYDADMHRRANPQDATAEGLKMHYLLSSFIIWGLQCFIIYKALRFPPQ